MNKSHHKPNKSHANRIIRFQKKIPSEKSPPNSKPNAIPNLTKTPLLTPHGGFFPGGFFPEPYHKNRSVQERLKTAFSLQLY